MHLLTTTLLALASAPVQDDPRPIGFGGLAEDPYVAGLFGELAVTPGPPARVRAELVEGTVDGTPFVNVVRLADARPFRGQVASVRLPVRLTAPAPDTSARLWVKVLRADGSVAYQDDGFDQASSSAEWTTLSSTGAIAPDATDLCFGLVVTGTTAVEMDTFELVLQGEAKLGDRRHEVPQRWTDDPDVRVHTVGDPEQATALQVTTFVPPGHSVESLPQLWFRQEASLRETYVVGRALLESMRRATDPPAIVSFVDVPAGHDPAAADLLPLLSGVAVSSGVQALVSRDHDGAAPLALLDGSAASAPAGEEAEALAALCANGGLLHAERVLLRWLAARHDAGGDPLLAEILLEASLAALEPWQATPVVRQASHSLHGHDCGHDHSHDHSHDH